MRINQIIDSFADGTLSKPEFQRAKDRADQTLQELQRRINQMHVHRHVYTARAGPVRA